MAIQEEMEAEPNALDEMAHKIIDPLPGLEDETPSVQQPEIVPGVPLIENQMNTRYADREFICCLLYGDPGSRKSTMAASFPKPILVLQFDPLGKAGPYRRAGRRGQYLTDVEPWGIDIEYVMSTKEPDRAIIEINYFKDEDIKGGASTIYGVERFEHRMIDIFTEIREGCWATVVLDSLTFLNWAIVKLEQYKRNPLSNAGNEQDGRQWRAKAAEGLEEACFTLATQRCNVVVAAHVRELRDNQRELNLWTPEAPGKRNRTLPAAFSEVYAMHHDLEIGAFIQSNKDTSFVACTQINAPDGVQPLYKNLWSNYQPQGED